MKYIVIRCKMTGIKGAMVFSEQVTHKDVFAGIRREFEAESAGFCYVDSSAPFGVRVEGKSESLGLNSDPFDAMNLSLIGIGGGR